MAIAGELVSNLLEADQYLRRVLADEAVDTGPASPVRYVQGELLPVLQIWLGGRLLSVEPSGAFVKGTAIRSGAHIDLLLCMAPAVRESMQESHNLLFSLLYASGYAPRQHNVAINVRIQGHPVDLVLAHRESLLTGDHLLHACKHNTWIKTSVARHIAHVQAAGRLDETRILKLWRTQHRLDFPSIYLEMVVIRALAARSSPYLSANVSTIFEYLRDAFPHARFVDPANDGNVLSDTLTANEKTVVSTTAHAALAMTRWRNVVR